MARAIAANAKSIRDIRETVQVIDERVLAHFM